MKIAIPVEEKSLDTPLCVSFGRTPYFALYSSDSKECIFERNPAENATGGAGVKAAQKVIDMGADTVICQMLGENASELLKSADIKIYKALKETCLSNIEKCVSGELCELTEFHKGFHHGGN